MKRFLRWTAALAAGALALVLTLTWVWWQDDPAARGTGHNALWARHQWVGEPRTEAQYARLAGLVRDHGITDVFFHAGPFARNGGVPAARYPHAKELLEAFHRLAPGVRAQAYLGQIRKVDGEGLLPLDDPAVRARVAAAGRALLDLGFDGIHYDIEPVYPDDTAFLDLLDRSRVPGRLLSVALEQATVSDAAASLLLRLPRTGPVAYPARPTTRFLRDVAARVDQVAIMTYDTKYPTQSLTGRYYADHTERTLRLLGDDVEVFIGVPTYTPLVGWAENLPVALRGVSKGADALDRAPRRPWGVGVYADWTTTPAEWDVLGRLWE